VQAMEYKTLRQLAGEAEVSREPVLATTPMTKRERLERWAILLEREPDRRLSSVQEVEYGTQSERVGKRADDSALAVAFADPVLCAHGLASPRRDSHPA
jgi:hypothetical protein